VLIAEQRAGSNLQNEQRGAIMRGLSAFPITPSNALTEWMDPRQIQTHAMREPSEEERERPEMWRFWRVLPPRGKIGVFFHSWYSTPVLKRVLGKTTDADLDQSLDDIARFEDARGRRSPAFQDPAAHLQEAAEGALAGA
jgi:hypothetical protein